MPRNALAYLVEMDEACQFLLDLTATKTLQGYLQDKTARLAAERCFITLAEAMKQLHHHHPVLSSAFAERPGIVAFRNVIVHEYWAVDNEDVWSVLISKVPALKAEIDRAIESIKG
jgi:uncharacterized protein with HEPN domain